MTKLLELLDQNSKPDAGGRDPHLDTGREKMKRTILILIGSYLPGFKVGGPIQSIAALVQALNDEYDFKIICGDRDLGDDKPFPNERVGCWYQFGPATVLRIPPGVKGRWMLIRALRFDGYDILYLSGILSRTYSILPLLCRRVNLLPRRPVVVATRGELSTGALGIKPRRKRLYLRLAKLIGLFDRVLWQASTHRERDDILAEFGPVQVREASAIVQPLSISDQAHLHDRRIIIASDLSPKDAKSVAQREVVSKAPGWLRVVTIGRVCQMKNIDFAISLVKQLQGVVNYDIYGPLEDKEYLALCKRLCVNLPGDITVQFMGGIPHDSVKPILSNYHVFLLPTLGENFGHAISEAMQVGCVPIISDRTPWQNLQDAEAGWSLSLSTPEAFTDALNTALTWSHDELQRRSRNATDHVANHAVSQDGIRENRSLFAAAADFKTRSR